MYKKRLEVYTGNEKDNSRHRIQQALLAITTCTTVFAALPVFSGSDTYKMILLFIWIIDFAVNVSLFKVSFTSTSMMIIISWIFYMVYSSVMHIISGDGYINGTYFYSVSLCVFIYVNGCFLFHEQTKNAFNAIMVIYNACSALILIYIYITNFWGVQYLLYETYIYGEKNSIGPIIVSNLIVLAIRETKANALSKCMRIACQIFFTYMLLLVNNRAGIVELAIVLICYIFFSDKSHRTYDVLRPKHFSVIHMLVLFWAVLISMVFYGDILIQKVLSLFKWALRLELSYDLDRFSSGRITLYYLTINYIIKVFPLFGVGVYYTDLFYLSMIAEAGLVGAVPVFVIVLTILFSAVKNIKSKNNYIKLLGLLAVQTLTASLLEGLAPFGPGTVVFIFWLLFGAYNGSKPYK